MRMRNRISDSVCDQTEGCKALFSRLDRKNIHLSLYINRYKDNIDFSIPFLKKILTHCDSFLDSIRSPLLVRKIFGIDIGRKKNI